MAFRSGVTSAAGHGRLAVRSANSLSSPPVATVTAGFAAVDDGLFRSLEAGATVIARSHRQLRALQIEYGAGMLGCGRGAWPTPDIISWDGWLQRCWMRWQDSMPASQGALARMLLSTAQERRLWERLVGAGHSLLQVETTAATAAEAWELSWSWGVPIPVPDDAPNEDVRAFAVWARRFAQRCRQEGWQDRARLPDVLRDAYDAAELDAPPELVLYAFDELTPQQEGLIEAVRRCGSAVRHWRAATVEGNVTRHALPAAAEEIAAAASWARDQCEAGCTKIGVIVPDLGTRRAQVLRIFEDVFVPQAVLQNEAARPFNVSMGLPLAAYPAVSTALGLLAFGRNGLVCEEVGSLLRSAFVGEAQAERSSRALLDLACREGEPLVRLTDVLRIARATDGAGRPRAHASPALATRLEALRALLHRLPAKQAASAWAEQFAAALKTMAWPGDRSLDSAEYQLVEAWRELLAEFSSLDRVAPALGYGDALEVLRRMAGERIFQPQTPEVPVQIMGLFEAEGLAFDRLWITGLHDGVWPQAPRPNPFVDLRLQRARGLPHSSAAREYEFARAHTAALLRSSPQVVVSHPLRHEDEDLRPSPLIAQWPLTPAAAADPVAAFVRNMHQVRPSLDVFADERAPAITGTLRAPFGTGIFRDQAACPFRAFARGRLGARTLVRPEPGLDPRSRGILLHDVMGRLWAELRSRDGLVGLDPQTLNDRVERAVAGAVVRMAQERPQTMTARFRQLEQERLAALVSQWLELEKTRPNFTVLAPERQQTASFGGVKVNIVPDRVDEIDGGARVVIDYKTGEPQLAGWFGPRPDDPQLPIYALTQDRVAALAFARIRVDGIGFLGIARDDGIAPGIRSLADTKLAADFSSWDDLLASWRTTLEALGRDFLGGDAAVAPKDGHDTCRNCEMGPLCRIAAEEPPVTDDAGDGHGF